MPQASKEIKSFSLRVPTDVLRKFHYICAHEMRSANNQLLLYICNAISRFESRYGEICLDEEIFSD